MKNFFMYMFFAFTAFLFTAGVVYAASGRSFGGRIVGTQAFDIEEAESAGYSCPTKGTTLQIRTKYGNEGYFIPSFVSSATRRSISTGQGILAIHPYSRTIITCTKQEADGKTSQKTIFLKDIRYYGN